MNDQSLRPRSADPPASTVLCDGLLFQYSQETDGIFLQHCLITFQLYMIQ